jgi:hypothetical protein
MNRFMMERIRLFKVGGWSMVYRSGTQWKIKGKKR